MKWWRRSTVSEAEAGSTHSFSASDGPGPEASLSRGRVPAAPRSEMVSPLADPFFISRESRLNMEVDDASVARLGVSEQNARAILDATQRVRDHRERERATLRPVYNFGGEAHWPGGES